MISKEILSRLEYFKVLEYVAKYSTTEIGKELVLNSEPFASSEFAILNGQKVSEAKEILIQNDFPPLEFLPNLHQSLSQSRIEGTLLTINTIRNINILLSVSRKMSNFLTANCSNTILYKEYKNRLVVDKILEYEIEKIFTATGEIKDSASKELSKIRSSINEKNEILRKTVSKILKQFSKNMLVQDEYVTMRDGRVVLPIKAEHKRHVKGFIHSESGTGQTIYIEPEESLELNNDLLSLRFAEGREIERILKQITKRIGEASLFLKDSLNSIAELDAYFAKARYSLEIIGSFPSVENNRAFKIIEGYHPILLKKLSKAKIVPLSIEIKEKVIIITGPNAGGKTVVLKTVGLLSLLVMSGFHVPVNPDSNFNFFESVFVDIGDRQSIEDDLSTFSSHLANIKNILNSADKTSLVLLDELGTGTDPTEGAALASAILLELRDKKATVLATTHHGNLKILASNEKGLENASMEFNVDKLQPTYRFKQGLPGSSYAFEVASKIGIDDSLIAKAKSLIDGNNNKIEDFLIDLERKTGKIREQLNKYEIENTRLKGLTNLYQQKLTKLEKEKKEIIASAKRKASDFLENVNREVEQTIKSIKEKKADKSVIIKAKKTITNLKEVSRVEEREEELHKIIIPKVGDYVKIVDTTTAGEIISIDKNIAQILAGNLKVKAKISQLEYAEKKKTKEVNDAYRFLSTGLPNSRLDIRGNKPEEVEFEVVKFLDDAYSNGLDKVEIIHGKGTGVLKQMVQEILKSHTGVKDFHFAKIELGGEGVTIVELKEE
jgi:DNA mismatch repair protein MutS2